MKDFSAAFYPGSLAGRLATYVILFSSVIALGITASEVAYEYFRDLRQIDRRIEQIRDAYLDSITENVWVYDKERIQTLLRGINRQPDFVLAEIIINGKSEMRDGEGLKGNGVEHVFTLERLHQGRMQNIGEFRVAASYQGAYQRVLDRAVFFLMSNALKTFLVALFIFIIYYRLIGGHLQKIAGYAKQHAHVDDALPLALERPPSGQKDELANLVEAINHMRDELVLLNRAQQQRLDTLDEQAALLDLAHDAILVRDRDNVIVFWSRGAQATYGWTSQQAVGKRANELLQTNFPLSQEKIEDTLFRAGHWEGELGHTTQSGARIIVESRWAVKRDERGVPKAVLQINRDITERTQARDRIEYLARHDTLTQLPNRFTLVERLEQAVNTAQRKRELLAVLFIDLDRFKSVNDTVGHDLGDQVLIQVAQRLKSCVRDSDIVARLSGDEFVVVLTAVKEVAAVRSMADKVLHALRQPYDLEGHDLRTSCSIGVALFPDDAQDRQNLLKSADAAMYHAKYQGRNNVQFFTAELNHVALERLQLERDLRLALDGGQFELHYQPQVNSLDGRVVGVEALARWHHSRDGWVPPLKFIRIAEETGLIKPLGEWVLDEACRQLREWRDQGITALTMAVNLSASQLRAPTLLAFVDATLKKHQLTGADLELEITESVLMEDPDACIDKLNALRNRGVGLSIDDFGTGYSSLSYLKRLPIHSLKLDQSFVRDIETDANDVAICAATLALAHTLGLKVIAEGVETELQRDFLVAHHCDVLQGYLFSKPVPPQLALSLIRGIGLTA